MSVIWTFALAWLTWFIFVPMMFMGVLVGVLAIASAIAGVVSWVSKR